MNQPQNDSEKIERLIEVANYFSDRKQYDRAIQTLDQALQLDPRHAEAQAIRATCLSSPGDPNAVAAARQALALAPENGFCCYALATCLWNANYPPSVVEDSYLRAIRLQAWC